MRKIFMLSCGKSKLDHASPACEMYIGDLFKKSLAYARTQNPDSIYILSAKYGLLELDQIIEPYEMTLNSMPKRDRLNWAERVLNRLAILTEPSKSEFVFLTGEKYRENLVEHLDNVSTPLKGLSFGRQLNWLKEKEMKTACHHLHDLVAKLPRLTQKSIGNDVPENGLYFVFERGELSHSVERIVRIGTHTGEGNLQKRIREHLFTPKKDRSVFRKHIGRCILAKRDDLFLEFWERDLTSKHARDEFEHLVDFDLQKQIEDEVTDFINANMSFSVLKVEGKRQRLTAEEALLSTMAQCPDCHASQQWLGKSHPRQSFHELGLWNVQGLRGESLSLSGVSKIFGV